MDSNITLVVTSCGRHDLLQQTLESFIKCVDILPQETVIVEDLMVDRPAWLNYPQLGPIKWLQNETNMGQAYSIDRAYAEVKTDYIFHLEDDWFFLREGPFMAESKAILDKYPMIIMVALTNHKGWMVQDPRFSCLLSRPSAAGMAPIHDGITFNPGLRRLSDYKMLGASFSSMINRKGCPEACVSSLCNDMGYVVADLGVQYVLHIGGVDPKTGLERRCEGTY